jgi:hypothetical protein
MGVETARSAVVSLVPLMERHAVRMTLQPQQPGDDWLPAVIRLLDEQRGHFRELDALSRRQSQCVGTGETERLLGVLAEKQRVVERVVEVNAALQTYMPDWTAKVAALPERSRVLLRSHTDELESLASQVRTRDEADRLTLEAQSRVISQELATTAKASGAARAYGLGGGSGIGKPAAQVGLFSGALGGAAGTRGVQPDSPRFQDRKG